LTNDYFDRLRSVKKVQGDLLDVGDLSSVAEVDLTKESVFEWAEEGRILTR